MKASELRRLLDKNINEIGDFHVEIQDTKSKCCHHEGLEIIGHVFHNEKILKKERTIMILLNER